ncbi:hypothetical protein BSKO_04054 [Bryopsis sp. KO-2023]|nr:hypothetical protein BSKO_04054 [Bryopsis sp. KO-2023]
MKYLLICLLTVTLLTGKPVRAKECAGAPGTDCSAFKNLKIDQGPTVCSGNPSVDCKVVNAARKTIADAYENWLDEGFCNPGAVKDLSKTIAGTFAEILSTGLEKVTCEGKGLFCGYEVTDNAWALSLQELYTSAASDSDIESFTKSFCYGDLRSISEVIQTAVMGTSAICTQGGSVADYSAFVVETVAPEIENALNLGKAKGCGDRKNRRRTWCSRSGGRKAPGGPARAGDPCGAMGTMKQCEGPGLKMCCSRNFRTTICGCRGCNGPWIRQSSRRDPVQVFSDIEGVACSCPKADRG